MREVERDAYGLQVTALSPPPSLSASFRLKQSEVGRRVADRQDRRRLPRRVRFPADLLSTINTFGDYQRRYRPLSAVIGRVYQATRHLLRVISRFYGRDGSPLPFLVPLNRTFTGKVGRLVPDPDDRMLDAIERYHRRDRNYIPPRRNRAVSPRHEGRPPSSSPFPDTVAI